MNARTVEFSAGMATTVIALIVCVYLAHLEGGIQKQENETIQMYVTGLLLSFIIPLGPALSVSLGSYIHAIKQKAWGFWFLFIGAVINTLLIVMGFILLLWLGGEWALLLFVMEFFFSVIAVVAAFWRRAAIQQALEADAVEC